MQDSMQMSPEAKGGIPLFANQDDKENEMENQQEPKSRRCLFGKNSTHSTNDENNRPMLFTLRRTKSDLDVHSAARIRKAEEGENCSRSPKRPTRESCNDNHSRRPNVIDLSELSGSSLSAEDSPEVPPPLERSLSVPEIRATDSESLSDCEGSSIRQTTWRTRSCSALPGLEDYDFVNSKLDQVQNKFLWDSHPQKTTLPVVGIKDGVKYISSELLWQVLTKVCVPDALVMVVDCRFEYEFNGGHIQSAINIKSSGDVEKHFLHSPIKSDQRLIIVFHCEFSSHRGPTMCKHLRKKDREINLATYPELFYPELYVLEGGYKKFYTEFPQLCDPQGYITMFDPNFSDEKKRNITLLKQPKRSMSTGSISQPKIRLTQRHSMNGMHSQSDDMVMTSPTRPQGHVHLSHRPSGLHNAIKINHV